LFALPSFSAPLPLSRWLLWSLEVGVVAF
jgi:hypothetical protein